MDTGSAWISLAIEGSARGLCVHGLAGFEYEKAYEVLNIPKDTHEVCAMFCVGKRSSEANTETLTQRNPVEDFISEGTFVNREK